MKIILMKTLAIAVMLLAFSANPVMAKSSAPKCSKGYVWKGGMGCEWDGKNEEDLIWADADSDTDQPDNEQTVADSGNEDPSTSAASTNNE